MVSVMSKDAPDQEMMATAMELVLDRLDAFRREGDADTEWIDLNSPRDPSFQTALWGSAFGIASALLERLSRLDSAAADEQMLAFRAELAQYRQGSAPAED